MTEEQLGEVLIEFLAQHILHDIGLMGEDRYFELSDLGEYDTLQVLPDSSPVFTNLETICLGGIEFHRVPCEPLDERQARIKASTP